MTTALTKDFITKLYTTQRDNVKTGYNRTRSIILYKSRSGRSCFHHNNKYLIVTYGISDNRNMQVNESQKQEGLDIHVKVTCISMCITFFTNKQHWFYNKFCKVKVLMMKLQETIVAFVFHRKINGTSCGTVVTKQI